VFVLQIGELEGALIEENNGLDEMLSSFKARQFQLFSIPKLRQSAIF
jgi:hypothetical protein